MAPTKRWRRWLRRAVIAVTMVCGALVAFEARTSWLQARLLSDLARELTYSLERGPSDAIRYPAGGPYDHRLGYARMGGLIARLESGGFEVRAQARWSPRLLSLVDAGLLPAYAEKNQAGLAILDRYGRPMYASPFPQRTYGRFDDIPPVVVRSLLFVENRELLREGAATRNPAVEYDRLARAAADLGLHLLDARHPVSGGSTLATQLEKLRHWPDGRTRSIRDKSHQMASASVRAYLDGADTRGSRRRIVLDYVNALPLGSLAGFGEVVGLGDGLWGWYGTDFADANRLLRDETPPHGDGGAARARLYRQVLTMLLAVKKPTAYFGASPGSLDARVDGYLPVLAQAGVITRELADAARGAPTPRRTHAAAPAVPLAERKGADGVRMELLARLGVHGTYDLDRLDLSVHTTLDAAVSDQVSRILGRLADAAYARKAGLIGERLLRTGNAPHVTYSVTLYERTAAGNQLRVQADTFAGPLNVNEGTRLELGSTAKLRTLISYLAAVETLHGDYGALDGDELLALDTRDPLSAWAAAHLAWTSDRSLEAMLDAAMLREYSASPYEEFITGGGPHTFENFDPEDDLRLMPVRRAFQQSVNLVFIRVLDDVVAYHAARLPGAIDALARARHPARDRYLREFADLDGREFLRRFYTEHRTRGPQPLRRGTHPLRRWLTNHLAGAPESTLADVFSASTAARQEAYDWLFRSRHPEAQDRALRQIVEHDAFARIHEDWTRLGYPFRSLVPSLATAIGSSGDNPAALAELAGIISAGGIRYPTVRIEEVRFAEATPYETRLAPAAPSGERVLSATLASVLHRELRGVVAYGTGRRLAGGVKVGSDQRLVVGGKTGTGDNRFETLGPAGPRSRPINRTATFVFTIGERHFGSVMAYVPADVARTSGFTSALPVQLLKHLLPALQPLFYDDEGAPLAAPQYDVHTR